MHLLQYKCAEELMQGGLTSSVYVHFSVMALQF